MDEDEAGWINVYVKMNQDGHNAYYTREEAVMDNNMNRAPYNSQGGYTQPVYNNQNYEIPVSVGDWLVTMLLMCIPVLNLIMLFVWAFGSGTPKSKANWCKAQLIVMLIIIGLEVIGAIVLALMGLLSFDALMRAASSYQMIGF